MRRMLRKSEGGGRGVAMDFFCMKQTGGSQGNTPSLGKKKKTSDSGKCKVTIV